MFSGIYKKLNEIIIIISNLKFSIESKIRSDSAELLKLKLLLFEDEQKIKIMIDFLQENGYTVFKKL